MTSLSDLLERDRELEAIGRCLDRVGAGEGELLRIAGPAGIGKTALLRIAGGRARDRGFLVVRGRCSQLEAEFSFGLVRQLFEPLRRRLDAAQWARATVGAGRLADEVLSGTRESRGLAGDTHAALYGLYWFAANLAAENPLLIVVDDVQWADPASLRFLGYLSRRLEGVPLLVLMAIRSGETPVNAELLDDALAAATTPAIRPAALSRQASDSIVQARFRRVATDRFCASCHASTGGNPFLLGSLLEAATEDGLEPSDENANRLVHYGPDKVVQDVGQRLRRLGAPAAEVADSLVILGDGAPARLLAAHAEVTVDQVLAALDALRAAGLIAVGTPIEFEHPMLRAAVASRIAPAKRSVAHSRAVRVLRADGASSGVLAVHLLAVEPTGDAQTVEVLVAAADVSVRSGDTESAQRYLRRAIAEPAPTERRPEIQYKLGLAAMAARDPASPAMLREAVLAIADPTQRAEAGLRAARAIGMGARHVDAIAVCQTALNSLPEFANPTSRRRLRIELLSNCQGAAATIGQMFAAIQDGEFHEPDPDPATQWMTDVLYAYIGTLDASVELKDLMDRVERDTARFIQTEGDSSVVIGAILTLIWNDRLTTAGHICDALIQYGQQTGSLNIVGAFTLFRSVAHRLRGNVADADADARFIFELNMNTADLVGLSWSAASLVDALVLRNELLEADAVLTRANLAGELPTDLFACAALRESRGRLHLAAGRTDAALEDLYTAGDSWRSLQVTNPIVAAWRKPAAIALLRRSEQQAAAQLASDDLQLAQRHGLPRAIGAGLTTAALATSDQHQRLDLLNNSVKVLEGCQAPIEHAQALIGLGATHRQLGDPKAAKDHLSVALDIAYRSGATALTAAAREELIAAGARPRRAAVTGLDALTASERRVAQLAAAGIGNRDIAQSLFVTQRTVETHLRNAYAKLDVHSRRDLATLLTS